MNSEKGNAERKKTDKLTAKDKEKKAKDRRDGKTDDVIHYKSFTDSSQRLGRAD